ncbi:MAG: DUF2225 domain-containing protein [Treponemataceae bacterium]|nr:DUF2225 domain-containing protein [Treponemataceae bacterium]
MYKKHVVEEKKLALTYYSKQTIKCPVCDAEIPREELLSGSGRLVAGNLTDELRRLYTPSQKYGVVYPLVYSLGVCPKCKLSLFWGDFEHFDPNLREQFLDTIDERNNKVEEVFPYADFTRNRTLLEGCASYYHALLCYEKMNPLKNSTTMKRAILTLRLAWMTSDLHEICNDRNFDFMAAQFYKKALFFYTEAMRKESNGEERVAYVTNFGPDLDKNYGFDGVVYLCALLEYKFGPKNDPDRLAHLDAHKRSLARMFGLGKSSKNKPGPLLEHARNLYDKLTAELKAANMPETEDEDEE